MIKWRRRLLAAGSTTDCHSCICHHPRARAYMQIQGLFDVGNIILDEVKNGGKEARQAMRQDGSELRDFFTKKVRAGCGDVLD